jgi:hypothetical protein
MHCLCKGGRRHFQVQLICYPEEAVQKEKLRLFYSGIRLSQNSNVEISLTNPRLIGQPLP